MTCWLLKRRAEIRLVWGRKKVGSEWTPKCCHGVHVASPFEHEKNHFLCTKEPSGICFILFRRAVFLQMEYWKHVLLAYVDGGELLRDLKPGAGSEPQEAPVETAVGFLCC